MLRTSFTLAAIGSAVILPSGDAVAFFPPLPVAREPQITVVPPAPSPIISEPIVVVPPIIIPPIIPPAHVIPPVPPVIVVPPPPPSPIVRPPVHDCPPTPNTVPEPTTLVSAALGALTIGAWRRRRAARA